jgi:hypothetical protein
VRALAAAYCLSGTFDFELPRSEDEYFTFHDRHVVLSGVLRGDLLGVTCASG